MSDIQGMHASEAMPGQGSERLVAAHRPRLDDPVVFPSVTAAALTDRICAIALREKAYVWWWIAFMPSMALTLLLFFAIGYLFYAGIGIWGVSWPVMWGFAILSYVWWIAIASGGTIISALFFLVRADWRDSINRIAESMMLFGAQPPRSIRSCIWGVRGFSTGFFSTPTP